MKYSTFNWPHRGKRGWILGPFFGRLFTVTVERQTVDPAPECDHNFRPVFGHSELNTCSHRGCGEPRANHPAEDKAVSMGPMASMAIRAQLRAANIPAQTR